MVFEKFTQVSRNKDVAYNLQTVPTSISPTSYVNVLEITGERVDDTVFTLHNVGLSPLTHTLNSFGTLAAPIGLAVDQITLNVFVTDGNVIKVFDSAGSSLFSFGGTGTEDGQFSGLQKIRIFKGRLFAMDSIRGIVQVFELDGTYITQFGNTILDQPFDIAVDSRGDFYVLDKGVATNNGKVFIFDPTFLSRRSILSGLTFSTSIAINSDDIMYITDEADDNFKIFKTNGVLISTIGVNGTGDGEFDFPINVTIKNNNDVFISDSDNDRVQVFNKDGEFLYEIIDGSIATPRGLDFDYTNNTVLFTDITNTNYKVLSINTNEADIANYKVYGSSNTSTDYSDSTNSQWVNLLSIRDIEEGNSVLYDHDFAIPIPIDSRTYESFSNSWKSVLVQAKSDTINTTLSAFSRGQGE